MAFGAHSQLRTANSGVAPLSGSISIPPTQAEVEKAGSAVTVLGRGWTSVAVIRGVSDGSTGSPAGSGQLGAVLPSLQRVSGSWGSGRLLTSHLVSALITDDGRLLVGAVPPDLLYAAAAR